MLRQHPTHRLRVKSARPQNMLTAGPKVGDLVSYVYNDLEVKLYKIDSDGFGLIIGQGDSENDWWVMWSVLPKDEPQLMADQRNIDKAIQEILEEEDDWIVQQLNDEITSIKRR